MLFLLFVFPLIAMGKVFLMSNYPLPDNNLESVINEENYLDMVEIIKHIEGVKDVFTMKEGNNLYIYVERYPILKKVVIRGNVALWRDTIMSRLGLYEGMPLKEISKESIEERIKRIYRDEGFLDAKVGVTLDITEDGYVYLYIGIDEGDVYFTGGEVYEGSTLKREELDKALGLVKGRLAKESEFEDEIFTLQDFYINRGFLDSFVYFKGIKKEEMKKPFFNVILPVDERIKRKPLRVVGSLVDGFSNFLKHPLGVFEAITGKGHLAYPVFSIIEGNRYEIDFEGAKYFNRDYLLDISGLKEKGVDPFSLEEAKENIHMAYKRKGFFDAQVSYSAGANQVTFHIAEGERYKAVVGGKEFPYDEDRIKSLIDEQVQGLKKEGYTLAEGSYSQHVDIESKKVHVDIRINRGKRQILSKFLYEGKDRELTKIFKEHNDKLPAVYNTDLIETLNIDIKNYFLKKGYMEGDFNTDVSISEDENNIYYTYKYTIKEGPRYKLGHDIYYGYTHTAKRELSYMTVRNEFYSEDDSDKTLNNMIVSDIFSGVKIDTFLDKDKKEVHRLIQLSEDKRGMYDLSFGYNTQEKLVMDSFLGWKNLFGIGLNTGLRYRRTGKRELYSLDLSDNFLFTRRLWLKTSLFRNYEEHRSYTLTSSGFTISLGYRITDNTSIGPVISRTTNSALGELIDVSKYGIFLLREYKDNIFSPKRIHYDSVSLTRSIGDREYTKFELSTFYLIPLRKGINLSFKVAGGYVGRSAPIFERFFLGGLRDLRGYDFESVGQPQGGRYYTFGRMELEVPIRGSFVGIIFTDMGNVGDKFSKTIKNPKKDVGLSVGIKTPVGPIRFDVALPLERSVPRRLRLYLSVGYYY